MFELIDCEQGSESWYQARLGIPTASEFKTLLGIKKDARDKATRRTYMHKLAGEIITGKPMENYVNDHMARGKETDGTPSFRYISLLRDGARAHGLPDGWVQYLDSVRHGE